MKINYKKFLPHIIVLLIFLVISALYFYPQFEGKVLYQSDIISHKAMSKEARDFEKKTGEVTLWTNSMFSGMPTYQISAPQKHNYLKPLRKTLQLGISRPAGYFILGMISFYILMLVLGFDVWISATGAIAFSFLTNNVFLYEAGHMTKLMTIMLSPLVLAAVILVLRKRYYAGGILFAIAMGFELLANHIQMTYYLAMVIAILLVIEYIRYIKDKDYKAIGISIVIFIVGIILAAGSSASKLWTTYEYAKDTMRGEPILKSTGKAKSSSETKGLEWNYAMQWSNGALDLVSTFIPGVAGGSSSEKVSATSAYAKKFKKLTGRRQKSYSAPLYWGKLPFTAGPPYMGAVIIFLFVLGLLTIKNKYKWWAVISVILLFLLSMGKNFEFLSRIFYNYVPLYNKFRSPNSILGIAALPVVVFAIYTLKYIVDGEYDKQKILKKIWIAFAVTGGISLFFALLGPSMFDFSSPGDQRYESYGLVPAIVETRKSLMRSDALRTFLFIALATGALWAYIKGKINRMTLVAAIGIIIFIDLLWVDLRYVSHSDFQKAKNLEKVFVPRDVDKQIMNDKQLYFRVLDVTSDPFNNAIPSYFHKNIGGYHPAKLQRYQDMIDRYISKFDNKVLNMLNTKYIIQKQNNKDVVSKNPAAYGNAWFVKDIVKAKDANEEIDLIKDTDVKNTAIVHKEFDDYITKQQYDNSGKIELKSYAPNKLVYEYEAPEDGFVVFSDVWYGPNKGWNSYIDDKPQKHIRVNYIMRGMKVPAGKHEIKFEFKPRSYYLGETISLITSLLMIIMLIAYLIVIFKKKIKTD